MGGGGSYHFLESLLCGILLTPFPAFLECRPCIICQRQIQPASREKVLKYLAERACGIKRLWPAPP